MRTRRGRAQRAVRRRPRSADRADQASPVADRDHHRRQRLRQAREAVNGSGSRAFNLRFPVPRPVSGAEMGKQIVRDGPAVRVDIAVFNGAGSGVVTLLMPQRVLLKHRGDAIASSTNAEFGAKFSEEVMRSSVKLEATMPLTRLTLGQIASLREGQVIAIDVAAPSSALLSARNNTLFVCEFGKLGQNYTVRVNRPYDATQDLMEGLLPV